MTTLRRLGILTSALALGLAVALSAASPATAAPRPVAGPVARPVARPVQLTDGRTGGQLLGQRWYRRLQQPATPTGPFCLHLGRTGHVLLALLQHTCSVERGTAVLIAPLTSICSPLDRGHPTSRRGQLRCAYAGQFRFVKKQSVTVDGGRRVDVRDPRFAVASPQRTVALPPNNLYGVPPQTITFTAFGWVAEVRDLPIGSHTISTTSTYADGSTEVARQVVRIVRAADGGGA